MCVIIVGSQTSSGTSLGEIWNWPPYSEGREWPKKETGHPRLVGDSINKQGNLHRRLVLGSHKRRRFPFCTHQTESECFYRGLNWVQSQVTSQIEIPHFYLKAVSLEQLLGVGKACRRHIPSKGEGKTPPIARVQLEGQICGHVFLMTSPQDNLTCSLDTRNIQVHNYSWKTCKLCNFSIKSENET